jgi:hypothetical protein
MIGSEPMLAAGDENATGFSLNIRRVIKVRLASAFDPHPRYGVGGDRTVAVESLPPADVAEVSVTTNTTVAEVSVATNATDWGVAVRFTLPEGGKPMHRNAAAVCRLVDQEGRVVSEQFIENSEVFLEGNGRRGYHTLFLEVDGLFAAFGIETLTEPMVDVEGRLATGSM